MTLRRLEPLLVDSHATHANGILASNIIIIAGQVGVLEGLAPDSMLEQARLAMRNVVAVVSEGGGSVGSIAYLTWYVTSVTTYHECAQDIGRAFREIFGTHLPAMTLVGVTGLIDPRCQVEISGIALL